MAQLIIYLLTALIYFFLKVTHSPTHGQFDCKFNQPMKKKSFLAASEKKKINGATRRNSCCRFVCSIWETTAMQLCHFEQVYNGVTGSQLTLCMQQIPVTLLRGRHNYSSSR